VTLHILCSPTA